jgi:hypothetical protein
MKTPVYHFAAAIAALSFAACANDPSKLLPSAPTSLAAAFSQQQALTATLISEYQKEDEILRFLSRDNYSCGDPRAAQTRKYRRIKNPKEFVAAVYSAQSWKASVDLIQNYAATLKAVVDREASAESAIDMLTGSVKEVAAIVPPAAPYASAAPVVSVALKDIRRFAANAELQSLAKRMREPLAASVAYLEDPSVLKSLAAPEQEAFSMWDSCAREKLGFMLDISDPAFAAKSGPSRSSTSPWRPELAPPTALELGQSYADYLAQREKFTPSLDFKKMLDDVVVQNDKLASKASEVSIAKIVQTGQDICSAANAISAAGGGQVSCKSLATGLFGSTGTN